MRGVIFVNMQTAASELEVNAAPTLPPAAAFTLTTRCFGGARERRPRRYQSHQPFRRTREQMKPGQIHDRSSCKSPSAPLCADKSKRRLHGGDLAM